jgi:hypothetical protein
VPIDSTTDLLDVGLLNGLLARVHALMQTAHAANPGFFSGLALGPPPTLAAGHPDKHNPAVYDDPLKGMYGSDYPFDGPPTWKYKSVGELQHFAELLVYYSPGWRSPGFTDDEAAAYLGYPESPSSFNKVLFRRRTPRRIFKLTATQSEDYTWFTHVGSTYYWSRQTYGTCSPGDKAQFYAFPGTGFPGTPGNLATTSVPGSYRGVYVYQGAGAWTPAPPGAEADTLDSNNGPWGSKDWVWPLGFQGGDYLGPHLLDDVRRVCDLLE